MRDRAVAAARGGRAGALEQVQDALESICEETMRIETGSTALPNPPPPRIFGWQPRTQPRIALQRMGADVLKSDSVFVVNQWLYFVQELLRLLRPWAELPRSYSDRLRCPGHNSRLTCRWQRLLVAFKTYATPCCNNPASGGFAPMWRLSAGEASADN